MNMKLDKRIIQAINYNVKEIIISEEEYNSLAEETKATIKLNDVKVTIDNNQRQFICKF